MRFNILVEDKVALEIREASDWYFQNSAVASANFEQDVLACLNVLKRGMA